MSSKKKDKPLISPEDENVDVNFARELTKLNFEKACADIYSRIVAEITHSARCGLSVCIVTFFADDNIMAWLDEKLRDKGFDVEWERYINDNPFEIQYTVKWYGEGHE